jgi:hypothetical protein
LDFTQFHAASLLETVFITCLVGMIDDFIGIKDPVLKRENSTHLTILTHLASDKCHGWIVAGSRHPKLQLRNSTLIFNDFSLELNAERFVNEGLLL